MNIITFIKEHPLSYFTLIKNPKYTELYNQIMNGSSFLNEKINPKTNKPYSMSTRFFYAINNLTDYPRCKTCGNPILKDIKPFTDISKLFCSNKCAQKDPENIKKIKQSKLERYGSENYNGKEKSKKTCLEKYGVEYFYQTKEFKEKSKKTIIERYGVEHYMKSDEGKEKLKGFKDESNREKAKKSIFEKYGVEYGSQSKEIRKKMHHNSVLTKRKQFYQDNLMSYKNVEPDFDIDFYANNINDKLYEYDWKCKKCALKFKSRIMWGNNIYIRCPNCEPIFDGTSGVEKEISEYINSLGFTTDLNNRDLIHPKEIDIVVKKDDKIILGIEYDGLYWHSSYCGKDKYYHLSKTKECESKGIRLIHIFEDEWIYKKEIVKDRIKNILGKTEIKIGARKCVVKEIDYKTSSDFLERTHTQGQGKSSYSFGLFYNDKLVSVMTFSKPRKIMNNKQDGYELLRFSSELNTVVIGGFSKLLKYAIEKLKTNKIISYCDLRWSNGNSYLKNGFRLQHISSPNYFYISKGIDKQKRLYRYNFRKSILKEKLKEFNENKTEIENMLNNGYGMIWDCGNMVFIYK